MGSASIPASYADTAKRLAGRSLYAVGSGLVAGSRLVAKGVGALTADTSDKEPIRFLKFALLEWGSSSNGCGNGGSSSAAAKDSPSGGGGAHHEPRRLPVFLVGLASGFQVGGCHAVQSICLHASAIFWAAAGAGCMAAQQHLCSSACAAFAASRCGAWMEQTPLSCSPAAMDQSSEPAGPSTAKPPPLPLAISVSIGCLAAVSSLQPRCTLSALLLQAG